MNINNLHITPTPFRNESRILKETASLVRSGLVKRVFIVPLYEEGLREVHPVYVRNAAHTRARLWTIMLTISAFSKPGIRLFQVRIAVGGV